MNTETMNRQLPEDQMAHITDFCSRLAGEPICRCGANLTSRYCIWSYFQPLPGSKAVAEQSDRSQTGTMRKTFTKIASGKENWTKD